VNKISALTLDKIQDKDTKYFVEIEIQTQKVVFAGCDHKPSPGLDRGRQNNPKIHRLPLTKGQIINSLKGLYLYKLTQAK